MSMSYEDMRAWQMQEQGEGPRPLTFTADEIAEHQWENPDDQDGEILNMVMEKDMHDRANYWQRRAQEAEARLREIEGEDYE